MELLNLGVDMLLHMDEYLAQMIGQFGVFTYALLFIVIFVETGLVITPFLPGDSLLFAAGTFAALGDLNPLLLFGILAVAAVLGDTVNYWIGHRVGERAYHTRWIKREYLDRTHAFFEKHGGKTIFLARFVPIVRTFAPFVAGMGEMSYRYFISYNIVGGVVWVALFVSLGFFFGNIPFVRHNFEVVILGIVFVSVLPAVFEWWKARRETNFSSQTK
ncbi:MAG: DedA family protein [Anaerolineae bacterium]|nr:MAG: DedA family protein [Anaerolineae bacterium]